MALIIAVFFLGRVIQALGGEVFTSHDSAVYAPRLDPLLNHGSLVSFVGNAPRPWGLPLFYSMFVDDHARAVAQWAVATLAWSLLALELSLHMRVAAAKVVVAASVCGMALTGTVASWDFAILSESMSISLGVLVVAVFLRWRRLGQAVWLILLTALAVWWTFIRPDIRLLTMFLIAALAYHVLRQRRQSRRTPRLAVLSVLVLALSLGWYAAISPAMAERFKPYNGDAPQSGALPVEQEYFLHRLRTIVFTDPDTEATFRSSLGMPPCPGVDAYAERSRWDVALFTQEFLGCRDLQRWAEDHDYAFWTSFVAAAPAAAAGKYFELSSVTLGGDSYATIRQIVPGFLERLAFPSRRLGLPIAFVAFSVALSAALYSRAFRTHPLLVGTAGFLFGAGIVSAFVTVLMGTGEYRRFGMQETLMTKVAVIVLVACAVESVVLRWRVARTRSRSPHVAPLQQRSIFELGDETVRDHGNCQSS